MCCVVEIYAFRLVVILFPLRVPDQVSDQPQECDKDGEHIWHMDERHRSAER